MVVEKRPLCSELLVHFECAIRVSIQQCLYEYLEICFEYHVSSCLKAFEPFTLSPVIALDVYSNLNPDLVRLKC